MLAKSIHLIIGTLLLAIALRTWLVMGLVAPVTVSGSSMAPTLRGESINACCPRCEMSFDVGAEYTTLTAFAACPRCAEPQVPLNTLPVRSSDRLWIDRTAFAWRSPQRWDVVVSHSPHDAEQLCVKRIVGLPGESIQLTHGNIWVNGNVLRKTLAEQIAMRQTVYTTEGVHPRWKPQDENAWHWQEGRWQYEANQVEDERWLRYLHLQGQPVTDDSSYNAGVSRKLNRVRDFMLCGNLRMTGGGTLALKIDDGRNVYQATVHPSSGTVRFDTNGKTLKSVRLSATVCDQLLAGKPTELVYSNFDRQLLLAFDGKVELLYPLDEGLPPKGTSEPAAIGARGGEIALEGLTLYRAIFYGNPRLENSAGALQLKPAEYFLLGDNAPISVDSRSWGPVPGRLLLGKPMWVR